MRTPPSGPVASRRDHLPQRVGKGRRDHLPRQAGKGGAGKGRVTKRVAQKADGRYLIYFEKTPAARRVTS